MFYGDYHKNEITQNNKIDVVATVMSELHYESEIVRKYLRGEECNYFDYITTIRFISEIFSFDFHPREIDYEDIENFVVKFIERKEPCRLSLYDDTAILIESNMNTVLIKLDWQTRAGTLKYHLPYHDCLQAFEDLLADLKKYRMEVVKEIDARQEESDDEDSY